MLKKISEVKITPPVRKTIIAAGIIFAFLIAFFYLLPVFKNSSFLTKRKFSLKATATPTSTLVPKYYHYAVPAPLPPGKQIYNVSRGAGSPGPNIQQVIIEPFDPKKGEAQKIGVKVGSNATMKAVQVTVNTDYDVKTYNASLKEGTKINGVWETEITTNDTHDYVYRVRVEAQDLKEESSVTVTIR